MLLDLIKKLETYSTRRFTINKINACSQRAVLHGLHTYYTFLLYNLFLQVLMIMSFSIRIYQFTFIHKFLDKNFVAFNIQFTTKNLISKYLY